MSLNKDYFINLFGKISKDFLENINSLESFTEFTQKLGWKFNTIPTPIGNLTSTLSDLVEIYDEYPDISSDNIEKIPDLIGDIIYEVKDLKNQQSYFNQYYNQHQLEDFSNEFPAQLIDYLLCRAIKISSPKTYSVFLLFGIISEETILLENELRCNYIKYSINFQNLKKIISDPKLLIENKYKWNSEFFDVDLLNIELINLISKFNITSFIEPFSASLIKKFDSNFLISNRLSYDSIKFNVFNYNDPSLGISGSISINILGYLNDNKPFLAILLRANGGLNKVIDVESMPFTIDIHGSAGWDGAVLLVTPEEKPKLLNLSNGNALINGKLGASLNWKIDENGSDILILGEHGDSNLTAGALNISAKVISSDNNDIEAIFEVGIKDGVLNIENNEDGLLAKILPKNGLNVKFNLQFGYSLVKGFYIGGSSNGLSYKLPQSFNLIKSDKVKLSVEGMIFNLNAVGQTPQITVTGNINFEISFLSLLIKNIGYRAALALDKDSNNGNFGPIDINSSFKPPSGIGISIKSSTVSGGGFLDIDVPNHKYIGALELKIKKLSLVAIGILKTKLPGGKDGYSLIMIITAEGFKPIQLGFGFALAGVGGLIGLNRTANLQALRDGLRTGTNQSILFPKDVIKNADKIISDLETCFPDKEGRFLVGPMAKIVWGAPKPLINIDLGLIIEVPAPLIIAILGVVRAALPDEKKPKFVININFLGTIEFDKKLISFDATIYDSKIMTFAISGDMAFRLKWGEQSNFLLSVGGFHPSYTPPPLNLPELRRIALELVNKDNLKVGLQAYFAITSNTVQIGAKVEAIATHGKYNALGILWLDVLFQFNPFYFIADMGAMVAIRKGSEEILSACLQATLQGPGPWNVRGSAEFKVLKIGFKINFNETFGEDIKEKIEDKDVWPELAEAIKHKDNWSTLLPERNQLFVNIKERATDAEKLYVHPLGKLAMSQVLAPMNFGLEKFGHVKPKDYKKFRVDTVKIETLNSTDVAIDFTPKKDKFSPAQFLELTDEQKLSRPSFEDMESGINIGTDNLVSSCMILTNLEYQKPRVIDRSMKQTLTDSYKENVDFANSVLKNSSVYKAFSNNIKNSTTEDSPSQTTFKTKEYAVANKESLSEYDSQRFFSIADAQAYVNQIIKTTPFQKNKLMVSESLELV